MTVNQILWAYEKQRRSKGITQQHVVDTVGMSYSSYTLYMRGETLSQFERIIDILDAVGLELVVKQKGE